MGASCSVCTARVCAPGTEDPCAPLTGTNANGEITASGPRCDPPGCLEIHQKASTLDSLEVSGPIKKPELRGLGLKDVEHVLQIVKVKCDAEEWQGVSGTSTGKPLQADMVSMHDFNYYVVLPETAPEGVLLKGLDETADANQGSIVMQIDAATHTSPPAARKGRAQMMPLAVGERRPSSYPMRGHVVEVKVLRGRFITGSSPGEIVPTVTVDDVPCGAPTSVLTPLSMSWKEKLSPVPCKAEWFVSHSWGGSVTTLMRNLFEHARLRHAPGGSGVPGSFWISALCANQHHQFGSRWTEPDFNVMRNLIYSCRGCLLALDRNASCLSRLWCLTELHEAVLQSRAPQGTRSHKEGSFVDIVGLNSACEPTVLIDGCLSGESSKTKTTREAAFDLSLLEHGFKASVEEGQTSMQEDTGYLLKWIRTHAPTPDREVHVKEQVDSSQSYVDVNKAIRSFLAQIALPVAIAGGHKKGMVGNTSLPKLIKDDPSCLELRLRMGGIRQFTGAEYNVITVCLPPDLRVLRLHLEGCPVDGQSLSMAAKHLPPSLEALQLEHLNAEHVTDESLGALGSNLPHNLMECCLGFQHCGGVAGLSDSGVAALAQGLSRLNYLKKLFLNLRDNARVSEGSFRAIGEALPDGVEELQLRADGTKPLNRTLWFQTSREVKAWAARPLDPETWVTRVQRPSCTPMTREKLDELCVSTRADYALFWAVQGNTMMVECFAEPLQPVDVANERPEESHNGFFGTASATMQLPIAQGIPGLVHSSQAETLLSGAALRSSEIFERKHLLAQFRVQAIAFVPSAGGVVEYGSRLAWDGFAEM